MPTLESPAASVDLNNSSARAGGESSQPPKSALSKLIPVALLLLFVAQCAWFMRTQSLTNDEALHIVAGTEAWRFHRFERWNDHPPLVFLLSTLPVLATHGEISIGYDVRYADGISPSPEVVAWSARIVIVGLGVLLGILVWLTARRMFSEGAANFALAIYAFSPALIGNFSISCNDGATALITFAVAMQLVYWRRTQSWGTSHRPWPAPRRDDRHQVQPARDVRARARPCPHPQAHIDRLESQRLELAPGHRDDGDRPLFRVGLLLFT